MKRAGRWLVDGWTWGLVFRIIAWVFAANIALTLLGVHGRDHTRAAWVISAIIGMLIR